MGNKWLHFPSRCPQGRHLRLFEKLFKVLSDKFGVTLGQNSLTSFSSAIAWSKISSAIFSPPFEFAGNFAFDSAFSGPDFFTVGLLSGFVTGERAFCSDFCGRWVSILRRMWAKRSCDRSCTQRWWWSHRSGILQSFLDKTFRVFRKNKERLQGTFYLAYQLDLGDNWWFLSILNHT